MTIIKPVSFEAFIGGFMKKQIIVLAAIMFSSVSFAGSSACKGKTEHHTITWTQTADGVESVLENTKPFKLRPLGGFKQSGKLITKHTLEKATIEELMKNRDASLEFMVGMLFGRDDFRGDEDIFYSYGSQFLSSLKCE